MVGMSVSTNRRPHWAAGSYIDLVIAAVVMQILFFVATFWVGTSGAGFYNDNLREVQYALRIQLALGWMMCIIAGIGFSILPLIYDVQGFEKSLMRVYVGMNVTGQIAIAAAIMSNDSSLFTSFATVGITLLCASIISLLSPSMTIFRSKSSNGDTVGPFSYALGAFLPLLGLITTLSWILRDEHSGILDFSEGLVFDFFMPLALTALIISHINRRLEWEIIDSKNTSKVFAIYAILLLLALISKPLHERGDVSVRLTAALQFLPYFYIFIMLKPLTIISKISQGNPYNKMVISSIFWLPFIGTAAYYETMGYVETTDAMMSYYRWILIFGVAFQVLWGFTSYLHHDHKKTPMQTRKTQWFTLSAINLGTIITIFAFFSSYIQGDAIETYPRVGIALYGLAYFSILVYWIKETFVCLYTWHKIPMFYDKYLAYPEQGSGFKED